MLGVCRAIPPTGRMQGLLGGRFILALLASLSSIVSKALSLGMLLHFIDVDAPGCYYFCHQKENIY